MTDTCANCRFSYEMGDHVFCRFDPPEFVPPCSSQIKPVRPDGWCGKHEKLQTRKRTIVERSSAS